MVPDSIATRRFELRRWRVPDAPLLKAAIDANLAHLQAWMPWAMTEPSPLEAIQQRIALFEEQFDRGEEWLFSVRDRAGAVLGGIGLHTRSAADTLEIGYWLQASAMGNGVVTEAVEALTRLALKQPGIERVQIRCDPRNVASAAIPQRLGFRHRLTIEDDTVTPAGGPRSTMVWEVTREEFADRVPPASGS